VTLLLWARFGLLALLTLLVGAMGWSVWKGRE